MQKPRKIKRYCPKCKKHTVHSVEKIKKASPKELAKVINKKLTEKIKEYL